MPVAPVDRWRRAASSRRISSSCSPSVGGGRTSSARSPSNDTGERTVRNRPITGCVAEVVSCRCFACGSSSASLVSYIGEFGTSSACSRAHHSARGRAPEALAEQRDQRLLVLDAGLAAWRSAGRANRSGRSIALRQALPELLRRRHVQRDPLAVARTRARTTARRCGRLYGPITSSTWKKWVKASRLKCAIASSIETSTVRPTPVRPRSISAPRTP